jgi:hypothetical protein
MKTVRYAGYGIGVDEILIDKLGEDAISRDDPKFIAYYGRAGKLVCFCFFTKSMFLLIGFIIIIITRALCLTLRLRWRASLANTNQWWHVSRSCGRAESTCR